MSDTIIRVENLGKKYIIGHQAQSGGWKPNRGNYVALRDVVANGVKSFGKRLLGKEQRRSYTTEEFWALKDINFEIKRGEVVGIIGRNGAGKSTLLKILSRITEPTTGRIELRGRVASLLEVGTGFHPELTGRENIYLNGSILGMSRLEIRKKFDEIVAFAEVERFLDTPVKRYSSGMYVRLAFAVAAHLEPEILVVDEVLAVGDTAFQKKCLGKMEDVATQEGRTVLFVSHNMAAVENLCSHSLLLETGNLLNFRDTQSIIEEYIQSVQSGRTPLDIQNITKRKGNGKFKFLNIRFLVGDKEAQDNLLISGKSLCIEIEYESQQDIELETDIISIGFKDQLGTFLFSCPSNIINNCKSLIKKNHKIIKCIIPKLPLTEGIYKFSLFSSIKGEITDWLQEAGEITVLQGDFYGTGKLPPKKEQRFLVEYYWDAE
ncbi:ABC transporter ATP-binding protein [Synechococcus sp. BDU 130192]|uniref:ABC transporter ATP-binding protein n=1 Tax=Synechococcus sp. BDU 130192 TaxID=2042059 RepID=UPI000C08C038|nr:ABC transporter ATP-binding protein [Synechococcus sp. BDU 130192]